MNVPLTSLRETVSGAQDALLGARPLPPPPVLQPAPAPARVGTIVIGFAAVAVIALFVARMDADGAVVADDEGSAAVVAAVAPAAATSAATSAATPATTLAAAPAPALSTFRVEGEADFDAEHGVLEAGPYRIVFDTRAAGHIRYAPTIGTLEVQINAGDVELLGPGLRHVLVAGQSVTHNLGESPSPSASSSSSSSSSSSPPPTSTPTPPPAPPARPEAPIVVDADAGGDGAAADAADIDAADIDDAALEAAARAARRTDPSAALRAWSVLVERHPHDAIGHKAAFMAGRSAIDLGDDDMGVAWLERALLADSDGAFAEEAHGRIVEALARAGHRDAARARARLYLKRFPAGAYVDVAAAIALGQ